MIAVGSSAHKLLKTADIGALMHPPEAAPRRGSNQRGRYQMRSYQTAKLAVTTWICGLARRWADRGVTANVLDPGIVKGKSGSQHFEGPALMRVLMGQMIPFFVAAGMERGARQYVRLAADSALATVSGVYFVSGKEKQRGSSPLTLDPAAQKSIDDAGEAWAAPFLRQAKTAHDQLEVAPRHELLKKGLFGLIGFRLPEGTMGIKFSVLHPVPFLDPAGEMIEGLEDRALSFLQPFAHETPPNHLPSEQGNY